MDVLCCHADDCWRQRRQLQPRASPPRPPAHGCGNGRALLELRHHLPARWVVQGCFHAPADLKSAPAQDTHQAAPALTWAAGLPGQRELYELPTALAAPFTLPQHSQSCHKTPKDDRHLRALDTPTPRPHQRSLCSLQVRLPADYPPSCLCAAVRNPTGDGATEAGRPLACGEPR